MDNSRETGRRGVAAYLVVHVKKVHGFIRKVQYPGHRGAPDYLISFGHGPLFVETKANDGTIKPHQEREHYTMRTNGMIVEVLYNKTDVDRFIENYNK